MYLNSTHFVFAFAIAHTIAHTHIVCFLNELYMNSTFLCIIIFDLLHIDIGLLHDFMQL